MKIPTPSFARSLTQQKICILALVIISIFLFSDRVSAAVITVDGVACTLQNAITASNTNSDTGTCKTSDGDVVGSYGDDEIVLVGNITLTTVNNSSLGPNGLPVIDTNGDILVIRSNTPGTPRTIARSGATEFRLMYISGGEVTLRDLVLDNGIAIDNPGGNLLINETGGNTEVTIESSTFKRGNVTDTFGLATVGGGGIAITAGNLTITGSIFEDNGATSAGVYGAGLFSMNATVDITDTEFTGNTLNDPFGFFGSALAAKFGGTLTLDEIHVHNNSGLGLMYFEDTGLVVRITDSIIEENTGAPEIVFIDGAFADIIRTTFQNNTATTAAFQGLLLSGFVIDSSDVAIDYSTIAHNEAIGDYGIAGVVVKGGFGGNSNVYLTNSTISGNEVLDTNGFAGVVALSSHNNRTQNFTLTHTTITDNTASNAGITVHGRSLKISGTTLNNNIIFNNHSTQTGEWSENCILHYDSASNATLASEGGNIFGDMSTNNPSFSCAGSLDPVQDLIDQTDIGLDDDLADNGGPTQTHALDYDSLAVDFGIDGSYVAPDDQRGEDRPFDGNGDGIEASDSGSYEINDAPEIEEAPCDTADCTPELLRFACKDPAADPLLSSLFLAATDVRYSFYTHLPLLCKYANFSFIIEVLTKDETLEIPELTPADIPEAFDAVIENTSCPIFSQFISPKLFYNKTERREILLWQTFLRDRFGEILELTGLYDQPTRAAIMRFQERFGEVILRPWTWGPSVLKFKPTGRVYKLTQSVANILTGCSAEPQWVEDAQIMFDVRKAMEEQYPEALQNLPTPGTGLTPLTTPPPTPTPTVYIRRR